MILWGYVLIWYSCGECSIDVKGEIETMEEWLKIRLSSTFDTWVIRLCLI